MNNIHIVKDPTTISFTSAEHALDALRQVPLFADLGIFFIQLLLELINYLMISI